MFMATKKLKSTKKKIYPKQKRFCSEYVIDFNATQAAIRAGYSKKTAYSQGQRLLKKVEIENIIAKLQKDIQERNKMTVDECVSMLSSMAKFDIKDIYDDDGTMKDLNDIPKETRLVIEGLDTDEIRVEGVTVGISKKIRLSNRRANIIELMKHLGGYEKDNHQKVDKTPTREERDRFLEELKKEINNPKNAK